MRQREEEQQLNTLLLFLYKFVLFQREGAAETGKWCNPVISRDGFSLVRQLGFSFYCCRPFFVFVFLDVHLSRSREHSVIPWQGIPWFRPWWYTESLLFSENDRIHSPPRILRTRECVGVSLECIYVNTISKGMVCVLFLLCEETLEPRQSLIFRRCFFLNKA